LDSNEFNVQEMLKENSAATVVFRKHQGTLLLGLGLLLTLFYHGNASTWEGVKKALSRSITSGSWVEETSY